MNKTIDNILDSLSLKLNFDYSIRTDTKSFGSIIVDIKFDSIEMRSIASRDGFETYICPLNARRYTYSIKEILIITKLNLSYDDNYPDYLYQILKLFEENRKTITELFVMSCNKPIIDKYVGKSNRLGIWS